MAQMKKAADFQMNRSMETAAPILYWAEENFILGQGNFLFDLRLFIGAPGTWETFVKNQIPDQIP